MKYIFGPVPSRRLGMSLGVDIVPRKTCTFDCVYCQLGITPSKSVQRQSYVPKDEILDELQAALHNEAGRIDFITFSGSGEPTLNSQIGEIIHQIKTFTRIPVAVITNGSLLYREDVRQDLSEADLVMPSLDAIGDHAFAEINRPHEDLSTERIVEGLQKFVLEFKGKIWLEIFLVKGVNDDPEELEQLARLAQDLKVDKIHLNTVARPPAEDSAIAITAEEMRHILTMFDSRAEAIVDFDRLVKRDEHGENIENEIASLLRRRPCTVDDLSNSLGVHRNEIIKHVNRLAKNGSARRIKHGDKWYYERVTKDQE